MISARATVDQGEPATRNLDGLRKVFVSRAFPMRVRCALLLPFIEIFAGETLCLTSRFMGRPARQAPGSGYPAARAATPRRRTMAMESTRQTPQKVMVARGAIATAARSAAPVEPEGPGAVPPPLRPLR